MSFPREGPVEKASCGTSLVVWWSRAHASSAGGVDLIPHPRLTPTCYAINVKQRKEKASRHAVIGFLEY